MAVSFIGGRNRNTRRKPPTCRKPLTNLSQNVVSSTPSLRGIRGFELTTLVVIGTDCIGSCKPTYHLITTMTASFWIGRFVFTSKRKFKQWWSTIRQILRSFLIFTLTKGVEIVFYFTRSSEHNIFLFFTMLNNKDTNTFEMTSLQRHKYFWDDQLTKTQILLRWPAYKDTNTFEMTSLQSGPPTFN